MTTNLVAAGNTEARPRSARAAAPLRSPRGGAPSVARCGGDRGLRRRGPHGGLLYWRGRGRRARSPRTCSRWRRPCSSHRSGVGLLLLADDRRAGDELHYAYGAMALGVALAPWFYAPESGPRRLLWFAGHDRCRGRARDPGLHDRCVVRRLWENRFLRGLALVALVSARDRGRSRSRARC